jgi:thiamine biosynthesis lipoprotein
VGCNHKKAYNVYQGEVFGTYYRFQVDSSKDFGPDIDSIFLAIDQAANSYNNTSEISIFNREGELNNPSATMVQMLDSAKKYHTLTDHYFNPALYPLIQAWGKSLDNRSSLDSTKIDSLLKLIDFGGSIKSDHTKLQAKHPGAMMDLSGLGEGFALDRIAQTLDNNDVKNYMVEIGGEMKCKGVNGNSDIWRIGIENPNVSIDERGSSLMKIVKLDHSAISTSGSYRKFYTDSSGNKYPHIIDPKSGYPVSHNLLSVSIISESSTEADAIATACMAMGTEKAKTFLGLVPHLAGFLIFDENGALKTWQTSNFPE